MLKRQPLSRLIVSRVYNLVIRFLFLLPYQDTQCGAKVFRRDAIERVGFQLSLANYAFDIDLLLALQRAGLTVVEIPVYWTDVPTGSKVNLIKTSISMLTSTLKLRVDSSSLRYFPYFDLLARSAIIPNEHQLTVMFLVGPELAGFDGSLGRSARLLESCGYRVRWMAPRGIRAFLSHLVWYVRRGHHEVSVIIECGSRMKWLYYLSVKPKIRLPRRPKGMSNDFEIYDAGSAISALVARASYEFHFEETDGTWKVTNRDDRATALREAISLKRSAIERFKADAPS
jgi:hypothetical protein